MLEETAQLSVKKTELSFRLKYTLPLSLNPRQE